MFEAIGPRLLIGEGPVVLANGAVLRCYVCNNGGLTDADMERLHKVMRERIVVEPSPEEDIYDGRIEVLDLATGELTRLYDGYEGVRLMAPNDIVFDSHGAFYFTDSWLGYRARRLELFDAVPLEPDFHEESLGMLRG